MLPKIWSPEAAMLARMVEAMRAPESRSPVVAAGLTSDEIDVVVDVLDGDVLLVATSATPGLWLPLAGVDPHPEAFR